MPTVLSLSLKSYHGLNGNGRWHFYRFERIQPEFFQQLRAGQCHHSFCSQLSIFYVINIYHAIVPNLSHNLVKCELELALVFQLSSQFFTHME
jgi:hypothetical protein